MTAHVSRRAVFGLGTVATAGLLLNTPGTVGAAPSGRQPRRAVGETTRVPPTDRAAGQRDRRARDARRRRNLQPGRRLPQLGHARPRARRAPHGLRQRGGTAVRRPGAGRGDQPDPRRQGLPEDPGSRPTRGGSRRRGTRSASPSTATGRPCSPTRCSRTDRHVPTTSAPRTRRSPPAAGWAAASSTYCPL